jgi:hypothetical protein
MSALLHTDTTYPWSPAEPDSDAFFETLEQEFQGLDASQQSVTGQANRFFAALDQLWANAQPSHALQALLAQRFAMQVPQTILATIAQKMEQSVSAGLSVADRLVDCVQEILPQWSADDLYVFARPLAVAMRSPEAVDATLKMVRPLNWSELSDTEQARLSLAIAYYALAGLNTDA